MKQNTTKIIIRFNGKHFVLTPILSYLFLISYFHFWFQWNKYYIIQRIFFCFYELRIKICFLFLSDIWFVRPTLLNNTFGQHFDGPSKRVMFRNVSLLAITHTTQSTIEPKHSTYCPIGSIIANLCDWRSRLIESVELESEHSQNIWISMTWELNYYISS